jgi:ABC-2 type transport system ATP-binding protein
MDANTVIRVTDVSKRFGSFTAVDHASLSVNHGDIFGFIGKNGAGKTTLMRMIAGLMKPTGGTLSISGREVKSGSSDSGSAKIGFLPQNVRFDDNSSAKRIIEFFAGLKKTDVSECLAFAEELGLDLEKKAKNMSPGQQRKLQLVIAGC